MFKSLRSIAIVLLPLILLAACVEFSTSGPTATPTTTDRSPLPGVDETPQPTTDTTQLRVGQPFVLDGTRSVDDAVISTFMWIQVKGPHIPMNGSRSASPSVVPQHASTYEFELVVTDNNGLVSTPQTATFVVGNDPPEVRITSPGTGMVGGQVAVRYTLTDSTADLANIQVEYSVDGGHTFIPATPSTGDPDRPVISGRVPASTGAATSLDGTEHIFVWNAAQDLGGTVQDIMVRVTQADPEVASAAGPFTYHPLLDEVTAVCGEPDENGDGILDGWAAARTTLVACQNRLLASLARDADALRQASSIRDATGIAREPLSTDISHLSAASKAQTSDTGPLRWMAPEAISRSYTETQVQITALEQQLSSVGDDAQLANIDLQNALQKQQQTLQTISNVSKMLHDTAMAVIRKIG